MPATGSKPPPRRRLKHWLKRLHLWIGLSVGAMFALIALSGSVLALQMPLLRVSQPQLFAGKLPDAQHRAAVLARIEREWAPRDLRSIDLPSAALPAWQLYFPGGVRRYLDPLHGDLLLARTPGTDVVLTLRDWHTHLLAGRRGENVLGVLGWISLGLLLSGLVLWWPGRRSWRAHLRPYAHPPVRRWVSWHRSVGALALPLLLTVTLTGTLMAQHDTTRRVLQSLAGQDAADAPHQAVAPRAETIDWQALLAAAQAAMPQATPGRITLPRGRDATVAIRARAPGEWNAVGRSMIWLDPYRARVLAVRRGDADSAARIDSMIYPVHAGAVGGPVWRGLVILCGLLPLFLVLTGFAFWRARTRRH